MITVQRMTPFFTKLSDFRLRLVFAYQYLSIEKGGETFQFVPTEGKEIVINMKSLQVENLGEMFVFQQGNRYLRLPLYQLLLISDLHHHLNAIVEEHMLTDYDTDVPADVALEAMDLILALEHSNRSRMIDYALETDNLVLFHKLTEGLQEI